MTKFYKYLIEKSYKPEDIPQDFWVVFDLEEMLDELKNQKVKGLKGISSDSNIQFEFLGVARDAMLQMSSNKLLKENKITRIMYENPHYLVSKNLWALRRLYNATQTHWVDQVFGNIFEQLQKNLTHRQLKYDMGYHGFRNVDWDWAKKMSSKMKVNNIKDLTKIITNYINNIFSKKTGIEYNIKESEVKQALWNSLVRIGEIYSTESEWVIKNDYLNIPKNSILYVLVPTFSSFNQEMYDIVKSHPKASRFDIIPILNRELLNPEEVDKSEFDLYRKKVKIDNMINQIKDKYKIIEYEIAEFKKKQREYWSK